MRGIRLDHLMVRGTGAVTDRFVGWTPPWEDPADLIFARQALDHRQFAEAERHLRRALDSEPESAEARTLMGVLHDRLGEFQAGYQCYKLALELDPQNPIALAGLRRYCERFGLDFHRTAINPAFDGDADRARGLSSHSPTCPNV
jgi:tetratricopeptide (TPR) repeat protein